MLEIVEAGENSPKSSMIFCTQYETDDWYGRIDPEFAEGSPISEAIMDRIIIPVFRDGVSGMSLYMGEICCLSDGKANR